MDTQINNCKYDCKYDVNQENGLEKKSNYEIILRNEKTHAKYSIYESFAYWPTIDDIFRQLKKEYPELLLENDDKFTILSCKLIETNYPKYID